MPLLSEIEINTIANRLQLKIVKWHIEEFKEIIGYLGDHLKLTIEAEKDGVKNYLQLFVKCMPRYDKWKSEYLKEVKYFDKEYVMLNNLFVKFENGEGTSKWRPESFYLREDLFVFEDVSKMGYKMPHYKETMTFDALKASVKTVARFHAQSYIYEEKRSAELGKPYRIWEEFSEYLQEPDLSQIWRDTGRNAVIDYLKIFSKHKLNADFNDKLDEVIPILFEKAMDLTKPDNNYRNVVAHKDLWSNNIFIKDDGNSEPHALLVDFQTVIYTSPLLDLSSVIYLNSLKTCREANTLNLIEIYYDTLSNILEEADINMHLVFPKGFLIEAYNESLLFGITQASLIVPYTTISRKWKEKIFSDPIKSEKVNFVSRSKEFIEIANEDAVYKERVTELLDELVERYIYPSVKQDTKNENIEELK